MRRRTASIAVAAGVVAIVIAVAATVAANRGSGNNASATSAKNGPITILWIGDTTGPAKAYGDLQLAGVKGAADFFNSRGGIDGHRVVITAVSDNGDPALAGSVLTRQLASRTPTMVWAGSLSSDSGAMIPLLARKNVFAISLTDGQAQCRSHASTACPHEWVLTDSSKVAPQAAADWMKSHKYLRAGVLAQTTPYAAAETPQFVQAAHANGITVTASTFPATTVDLSPELQALKQSGAQAVYAEGLGIAQYVFAARASLGWKVPVIFDAAAGSQDLTKLASPANIANAYEVNLYEEDPSSASPGVATMIKWASSYAKVTALPLNATSTGWDAVVALNAAVKKSGGSLTVDNLDRAMLELSAADPLRTLTHKLGYTKDNHENALGVPGDYVVIPVGPLVNGQIKTP